MSLERIGGWEVLEASSGPAGLELAALHRPDAVLLDVMMPDVDGPTTFRLLDADTRTHGIPVLLLTARGDHPERARPTVPGVAGVLDKPFDPLELAAQVSRALGWAP
jgi:CheY-like chemotaxis protein